MNLHFMKTKLRFRANYLFVLLIGAVTVLPAVTSCGTETGNPIIKRPTTPRNVAQDTVESELIDLNESLSETSDDLTPLTLTRGGEELQMGLTGGNSELALAENRSCSSVDNSIRDQSEKKKESKKEFKKRGISVSVVFERNIQTEWTSPNAAVKCTNGVLKKTLRLLKDSVEVKTGKAKRSISRVASGGESSKTTYSSATFETQGEWKTHYTDVSLESSSITVQKSIEWKLQKFIFTSTAEGESASESSSMTLEGAPMKVKIERQRPGGAIKARTIQSGSTKTTRPDGSLIELSFDNLNFQSSDSCYPSSGKLTGKITPAASSGQNSESFEIDFSATSDEIPEIVFSDLHRVPLSGACFE